MTRMYNEIKSNIPAFDDTVMYLRMLAHAKGPMYTERKANISAFRGCDFNCVYCAFQNTLRFQKCEKCKSFTPHAHLEVLSREPPKTKDGEFLTMSLTGDIAFATGDELCQMLVYCREWHDRTFVLQTKDPSIFRQFEDDITDNIIIGTTIESERRHFDSSAPSPLVRYRALRALDCRKMVTIEPIMKFSWLLRDWIVDIEPEIVYIGYDSKNNHLPEPTLAETRELIRQLRNSGIDVREKLMRKAWDEGQHES